MTTTLACPHCTTVLPPDRPGVLHCGACGERYTIAGPDDLARMAKKRADEKQLLLLVGGVFFLVYVAPILLAVLVTLGSLAMWLVVMLGVLLSSMGG